MRLPLFSLHELDATVAWCADGPVSARRFIAESRALADWLPAGNSLLNVCQDRYRFALGFAAGLMTGKVSLQPASQTAETLARIAELHRDAVCLRDDGFTAGDIPCLDFPELAAVDPATIEKIPDFPADQLAAILFTSGSTGLPQPHAKRWGKIVANGRAGAASLGMAQGCHGLVGTVPVQHSYGFESTLLLALHGAAGFWAGKPFYPQDIVAALNAVPRPRMLVTTPFHLSTLLAAQAETGLELPAIDRILSATAPLSAELAARAETATGAPVLEIYGSTETGQIATRRTLDGPVWQLMPDIALRQEGDTTWADGGHIEGRLPLGDRVELRANGEFVLLGRHQDLINIAGKRTSLAWLNHQATAIAGVADAAFYLPDEEKADGITRLAAFVVAPGLDTRQLQAELRRRIDPVFMPRPLVLLDKLPRNTTGKLPRNELQALYADWKRRD